MDASYRRKEPRTGVLELREVGGYKSSHNRQKPGCEASRLKRLRRPLVERSCALDVGGESKRKTVRRCVRSRGKQTTAQDILRSKSLMRPLTEKLNHKREKNEPGKRKGAEDTRARDRSRVREREISLKESFSAFQHTGCRGFMSGKELYKK